MNKNPDLPVAATTAHLAADLSGRTGSTSQGRRVLASRGS